MGQRTKGYVAAQGLDLLELDVSRPTDIPEAGAEGFLEASTLNGLLSESQARLWKEQAQCTVGTSGGEHGRTEVSSLATGNVRREVYDQVLRGSIYISVFLVEEKTRTDQEPSEIIPE